jgi:hypothetical protein
MPSGPSRCSILAEAAWRFDRRKLTKIDLTYRLQHVGYSAVAQVRRQGRQPGGILGLKAYERADGVVPALGTATMVGWESMWIAPREVAAGSEAGRFNLVFATLMNLKRLDRYATVADALQAAAHAEVVTVTPELLGRGEGNIRRMRIPAEAGYGGEVFTVDLPTA